jgi:4-hydroxy-tetrahydrodipicolinate reductase
VRWKKGATLDPPWVIERDGWVITVEGLPTVTAALDFLPPPDFQAETIEEFMAIGHIITALPALNAIAPVVHAPPGIVTYADLGMPVPRGWVRSV